MLDMVWWVSMSVMRLSHRMESMTAQWLAELKECQQDELMAASTVADLAVCLGVCLVGDLVEQMVVV